MSSVSPPVKHVVMEMRYAPTLTFYGVMDKIGIDSSADYPDWERSPLTPELRDKKHRRRCFLSAQRAFFEAVGFPNEAAEFDRAREFFEKLHHELKFTRIARVGIRQWASVTLDEPFPQLVKLFATRFQAQSQELDKILRGKLTDLSYSANVLTDNGWKCHIRLGPMEQAQWFQVNPYEMATFASADDFTRFKDSFGERMLFVDLDSFQEDMTFADLPSFMASIRRVSADMISELVEYIKG